MFLFVIYFFYIIKLTLISIISRQLFVSSFRFFACALSIKITISFQKFFFSQQGVFIFKRIINNHAVRNLRASYRKIILSFFLRRIIHKTEIYLLLLYLCFVLYATKLVVLINFDKKKHTEKMRSSDSKYSFIIIDNILFSSYIRKYTSASKNMSLLRIENLFALSLTRNFVSS